MDIADDEDPTEDQYETIEGAEDDEFILMDLKSHDDVSSMLSGGNHDESYPEIFVEERLSDEEDDKNTLVMLPSAKKFKQSRTPNNSSQTQEKQYCHKCDKAFSTKS